jgi:hypothetical protein
MGASWIVVLEWPPRARALRRRVVAELVACGGEAIGPGVFRVPDGAASRQRLEALLDDIRAARGAGLLARVTGGS